MRRAPRAYPRTAYRPQNHGVEPANNFVTTIDDGPTLLGLSTARPCFIDGPTLLGRILEA